ncbi:MAG: superoxide dismutase [Stenomitos rutilans HA7619-LM2]|jgi:Fe-Mn family superoxide dismutase|nr:superoxide dismutase [Stenomitos rutilans HA7619-LM2]
MAFQLPPLPYAYDALEPYMSQKTLEFHHDRHHATYVSRLNTLVKGTKFENQSLEEVILAIDSDSSQDTNQAAIVNNAAQVWNHTFFWNCMKPGGGGQPGEILAEKFNHSFGSFDQFVAEFKSAGVFQFGSGYVWLVLDQNQLKVVKTGNAANPMVYQQIPLLTCDVWEHAYYLDFQNRRPDFIQAFLDYLVNWEFVTQRLQMHQLARV